MNRIDEFQLLLYKKGDKDMRDFFFTSAVGIFGRCGIIRRPEYIKPIYISCDQLVGIENECCGPCFDDFHAGDYDNTQGRPERQYIESRHGLIIFYCCCDHQDIENLSNILDSFIENKLE